jgi:type I restriction enzyme S subunit
MNDSAYLVALDDLCNVEYGTRVVNKRDGGSVYPVYGGGGATFKMDSYNRENRIVIARFAMSEQCTRFVDGRFFLNDSGLTISPKNDELYEQYLNYQILSLNDEIYSLSRGAAQKNLNVDAFRKLNIMVVPLDEQKRIVTVLEDALVSIEQARAKAKQSLSNARELFESYLQQAFSQRGHGRVEMSLKEVSLDFGRGKSKHRPRNDDSLYGGAYPFIQTGDVRNCEHLIIRHSKTYNDKGLAQSKLWPKGTICITIAANIAETGILNFEACFPDSIIGVVVNPKITIIRYVEYLLQSFKSELKAKGQGAAQDNINMGTFEGMKFPFPSVDMQEEMVSNLDVLMVSVQELGKVYTKKLSAIDELKKSILQKAFIGEFAKE